MLSIDVPSVFQAFPAPATSPSAWAKLPTLRYLLGELTQPNLTQPNLIKPSLTLPHLSYPSLTFNVHQYLVPLSGLA